MTITARDLVRREVHYCVSALVSTLAGGYGLSTFQNGGNRNAPGASEAYARLDEVCEQALELASPLPDYEEAARDNGWQIRHDMIGFYACLDEEAEHEDEGNPSAGFDGRPHFETIEDAASDICEREGIDPYEREVFEHWIVSDWLADKLAAKGEKVDKDFAGLTVWARTTTGQTIYMDSVVEQITAELNAR